jgi:hypothetical protein
VTTGGADRTLNGASASTAVNYIAPAVAESVAV